MLITLIWESFTCLHIYQTITFYTLNILRFYLSILSQYKAENLECPLISFDKLCQKNVDIQLVILLINKIIEMFLFYLFLIVSALPCCMNFLSFICLWKVIPPASHKRKIMHQ